MAVEGSQLTLVGVSASADLSAKQFRVMKVSGDLTVTVTAAVTDKPAGILQDAPVSGQPASVCFSGVSKVRAGGTVTAGDEVGTDNAGRVVTITPGTDTTVYRVGRALSGGAVDEFITVLVSLGGRAA